MIDEEIDNDKDENGYVCYDYDGADGIQITIVIMMVMILMMISGEDLFKNPLSWDIVGKNLFFLTVLGVFFFILTLCIEYEFWYYKMPCFKSR